ncbi:hypothetical protein [Paenibacillus motobuensis]|uniref:Uncharacterized protein n=1 Tax=Paenibacillus motobuensis TaxID=295324 RepID=A0ABP3I1X2_9BACL
MIKIDLLTNGIDSLKSAYMTMNKIPELEQGLEHNLKDAVLSFSHGIEILFKHILKKKEEYLIFSDIDKFISAKKKVLKENKDNVFEVNPNLKTVTLMESIDRLKYLCKYIISEDLELILYYLNGIRNQLMHYEVNFSEEESRELLKKLQLGYELSVEFLIKSIENFSDYFDSARYEITVDEYQDMMAEIYAEMRYEEERELRGYYEGSL